MKKYPYVIRMFVILQDETKEIAACINSQTNTKQSIFHIDWIYKRKNRILGTIQSKDMKFTSAICIYVILKGLLIFTQLLLQCSSYQNHQDHIYIVNWHSVAMLFLELSVNRYSLGLSNELLFIIIAQGAAKLWPVKVGGQKNCLTCLLFNK